MGCDRAIHITTDARLDQGGLDPLAVAQLLQKIVEKESPDLVLVGKQSIDGDHGTTAPMLAELLGWSQATFAASLNIEDGKAEVERETDAGTEVIKIQLPAVVSADGTRPGAALRVELVRPTASAGSSWGRTRRASRPSSRRGTATSGRSPCAITWATASARTLKASRRTEQAPACTPC